MRLVHGQDRQTAPNGDYFALEIAPLLAVPGVGYGAAGGNVDRRSGGLDAAMLT
ncbi:MAG: hypothetical protein WBW93_07560 [Steroidobacteraceae bacterium]